MAKRLASSGMFPVPGLPAAMVAVVHLYVSSFQGEDAVVAWNAQRPGEEQKAFRIADGSLTVPGFGMATVSLAPQLVAGQLIEVNMTLPSEHVVPTLAIVTVFMGSDSQDTVFWLGPADFVTSGGQ